MKQLITFFAGLFSMTGCFSNTVSIENYHLNVKNSMVEIAWNCKLNERDYVFVIEKSGNAIFFTSVDTVYAQQESENYNCLDNSVGSNGILYYRLRCIKLNGVESASLVSYIEINSSEQIDSFKISKLYPVPFTDNLNLTIESNNDVTLGIRCHNLDGKLLFEMSMQCNKGCNILKIGDLIDLKNDSYYLTVSDGYLHTETTHIIKYGNR